MKEKSILNFCSLLEKHPHFNYRVNILRTVLPNLASKNQMIRKRVTKLLYNILGHLDQTLLDFKVDVLKELSKVLKTKPHDLMESNLLDCLVIHLILVDEQKARAVSESTTKSKELHERMNKLRRKGKLKEYKEMKQELLSEVKAADAIGIDLSKTSEHNNQIIKEILQIYFSILKGSNNSISPLIRSVFLGLP